MNSYNVYNFTNQVYNYVVDVADSIQELWTGSNLMNIPLCRIIQSKL